MIPALHQRRRGLGRRDRGTARRSARRCPDGHQPEQGGRDDRPRIRVHGACLSLTGGRTPAGKLITSPFGVVPSRGGVYTHQRDAGNVPNALVLPARQEGFHQGRGGMKLDKCVDQQAARRERETEYGARQALRPATTLPAEVDGRRRYQRPGRVLAGLFLQEKDSTALRGSEFAHLRLPRSIFEVVIETVASHRRLPRSPWRTVERKTA